MMCDDKVTNIYRTTLEEKVKETENGMEAWSVCNIQMGGRLIFPRKDCLGQNIYFFIWDVTINLCAFLN